MDLRAQQLNVIGMAGRQRERKETEWVSVKLEGAVSSSSHVNQR